MAKTMETTKHQIKKTIFKWNRNPNSIERKILRIKRLRIEHSRLTHGFLMAKEGLPLCESCGDTLSSPY